MNWTMPRPVLQWVAIVIGVACVGSFSLGIATAPSRGRLPGERASGQAGQALQAVDATPLSDDRIEGSSAAPQLSDEEKARLADEKEAKAEAEALAKAEAEKAAAGGAITPPPGVQPPPPVAAEPAKPPTQPTPEEPPF